MYLLVQSVVWIVTGGKGTHNMEEEEECGWGIPTYEMIVMVRSNDTSVAKET
jgi:hypothetical protein